MSKTAILCCGCIRVMGKDGTPLGERYHDGGYLDMGQIAKLLNFTMDAATFDSKQDADLAAIKLGWEAGDSDHRCPDCVRERPRVERTGAYIEWPA